MTGRDLRSLAATSDLARTDYEAAALSLATRGTDLVAYYRGAYASGHRWLPATNVPADLAVAVNALQFKALAMIFGDQAEVSIELTSGKPPLMLLKSKDRAVHLRLQGDADRETLLGLQHTPVASCSTTVEKLLPEVDLATEFTAKSFARPLFTGLNFVLGGGRIGVMAFDGIGALFVSSLECSDLQGTAKAPIPAYDLGLGLKLCRTGAVTVEVSDRWLALRSATADFLCARLSGEWPSYQRIMGYRDFAQVVTIDAAHVRAAASAAKVLHASNDLMVIVKKQSLTLRTREAEAGQFAVRLEQEASAEGTYCYDVSVLQSAALLGDQVKLHMPKAPTEPALVQSRHRRFWIAQRVVAKKEEAA